MALVRFLKAPALGFLGPAVVFWNGTALRLIRIRGRGFGAWSCPSGFKSFYIAVWIVYRVDIGSYRPR